MLADKTFGHLLFDVINKGKCTHCGGCVASCPYSVISFEDQLPKLLSSCEACGVCWNACPKTIYDYEEMGRIVFGRVQMRDEPLGIYRVIYSARSKINEILKVAQNGGIATTLLLYALDKNVIDGSIVSEVKLRKGIWRPWPSVATEAKELVEAAGTKYTTSPVLLGLKYAVAGYGMKKVGIIGTPCEVQAVRKLQYSDKAWYRGENIDFVIGLFCMKSFRYEDLMKFIASKGIEPKDITKFDIRKGKFVAYVGDKEVLMLPLDDIKDYAENPCRTCSDFSSEYADISVGAVGSPEGWSTMIIRTEIGEKIFRGAYETGYIEVKPIEEVKPGLKSVIKFSEYKKEISKEYSEEISNPEQK